MGEKLRATSFWVVTGETTCWQCQRPTHVSTLLLNGYEEEIEEGEWERRGDRTVLTYIETVSAGTDVVIQSVAPWMKWGHSKTAEGSYLANHCEACGVLQGDWFLSKPNGVFFPQDANSATRLDARRIVHPIEAFASPSWSSWHDWVVLDR